MTLNNEAQDWLATLLPPTATVQEAIRSLEASSMQIVLAVSETNKLIGTLTDGDIRRAFLKGFGLESKLETIIQRDPLAVPPALRREVVLELMKLNKVHQLPVVDQDGKVIGLHVWDDIVAPITIENTLLIMAGGKGSRLRPYTEDCPKPMLDVGGKPMLQHIIDKAVAEGFRDCVISINYLGHMIEEYFGDGSGFGVNIEYLRENQALGTAGCLSLLQSTPELPFVVTNGDVLTDIRYVDLLDFHVRHQADATMAVRQHEIQNQFGVVKTEGVEIKGFEEKPVYRSHVNAGVYALEPATLKQLSHQQHCDMPTLFERVKNKGGRTIVYPMHETWLDVGRPEDLSIARQSTSHDGD